MIQQITGYRIPPEGRQHWTGIASVWTGALISVSIMMIGGYLAEGFTVGQSALVSVLGFGFILVFMCLLGIQGCDTGLPTVGMAQAALGVAGVRYIISPLLSIVLVGWFGVQANTCGLSVSTMLEGMTGVVIPVWLSSVGSGILMFLTAMYGFKVVKHFNFIAVPLLVLVLGYVLISALFLQDGFHKIAAHSPAQPMSFTAGFNLVVASYVVGGVVVGDYARYAKNRGDAVKSSVVGLLPIGMLMLLLGVLCRIIADEPDFTKLLVRLGLPAVGLGALVLASWTTNSVNAYTGGLAISSFFGLGEKKFKLATGIAGAIGTVLGALGILNNFVTFLSVLTAFVPPLAGVMIADYWIIGRGNPKNFKPVNGFNRAGVAAFALGAAAAYITSNIVPFFAGPVNGIALSIAVYAALVKAAGKKQT
jgi:cytosine permease